MPAIRALIERVRATPPRRLPARILEVARRKSRNSRRRKTDMSRTTILTDEQFRELLLTDSNADPEALAIGWPSLYNERSTKVDLAGTPRAGTDGLREVASRSRNHEFDLLGSGWVRVDYKTKSRGAFGHRYDMPAGSPAEADQLARMTRALDESSAHVKDASPELESLRSALAGDAYQPIDWHLDYKSGYRWDPKTWHMDVPIGTLDGVDIKVPWELSRGHHLVTLALDAASDESSSDEIAREIALQLLDWIVANPPRFGVNWRTTMEVGIRAANWVWALSILGETPAIPPAIRWLVAKSLYQHGVHIINHLEYQADYTSNHYLANIVGLMHISFAYPEFPESAGWLDFCLDELVSEMRRTVYPDGVNYECSTGYHRLVTEMFVHGALLALRLSDKQRLALASSNRRNIKTSTPHRKSDRHATNLTTDQVLPGWFWLRLRRMLGYVSDVTKPNGLALQFGDQDSGRFLKLSWIGRTSSGQEPEEESRDHRHLLAIGSRLFDEGSWELLGRNYELDGHIATLGLDIPLLTDVGDTLEGCQRRAGDPQQPGAPESVWYPYGGTCVMRRGPFWIGVRCVPGESKGPSGHRHNDQLSFELSVDGEDFVVDWGTGVYTADRKIRNYYRSTANHSTAYPPGQEQNLIADGSEGVFVLRDKTSAKCIEVGAAKFVGEHGGFGAPHRRTIILGETSVLIEDSLQTDGGYDVALTLAEGVTPDFGNPDDLGAGLKLGKSTGTIQVESTATKAVFFQGSLSPGYGVFQDAWAIRFTSQRAISSVIMRRASGADS